MSQIDEKLAPLAAKLLSAPTPWDQASELEPDWLPDVPFIDAPVRAAVLIALVERAGDISVLYTERSRGLRNHSGQVAFPGGKLDFPDEPSAQAALREANEEVGLCDDDAQVLGYLPPYFTGTNYLITPVVAHVTPQAPFVANPEEVDEVFEVPLDLLLADEGFSRHEVNLRGRTGSTWRFDHEGHVIWGITANLSHKFAQIARAVL